MTNYEKIKHMSIDEMLKFMTDVNRDECQFCNSDCNFGCQTEKREWLESEVTND